MIRKAALASVLLVLLTATNVLAATKTVSIYSTHYTPATVKVAMGGQVQWKNTTGKQHNVSPDTSFLTVWFPSTNVNAHGTSSALTFPEAGTFTYHDSLHAALRGTIQVPMKADAVVYSVGTTVTLTLGTVPASNGGPLWHDVQGRLNSGAWTTISTTGANSTGWLPSAAGTWEVQTRLHHALSGANTGWSPILTITVI